VHAAAACVTVKVWPAIVSVALLGLVTGFAATLNAATLPPVPPAVFIVTHAAPLEVVQVQPLAVVTVTEPVPVPAPTARLVDESA
jgi:hypothetical protein